MTNGIRKILTMSTILLLVLGMSGCSKDTSIVDKIADEQYGTNEQDSLGTNNDFSNSTEETESRDGVAENTDGAAENAAGAAVNATGATENIAGGTGNESIDTEAKGIDLQTPKQDESEASIGENSIVANITNNAVGENSQVKGSEGDASIDVDLTELSSTMVYSEVYNMMNKPEDYVGKTIKIEGTYYASYWQDTGKYYHCVMISDAAACCQNGIEFVWDNDTHVYPDEYPPDNTVIELTGVFELYEEMGETYCYLKTDDITVR